jgi:hypothetical protein
VLVLGWDVGAVGLPDIAVFCVGVELMLCAAFYSTGRHDGVVWAEARRRRMLRQPAPPVASMAPAAGRRDASLPTTAGSDDDTQPLPRVVAEADPPAGLGPYALCLAGPDAQRAKQLGGVGCLWCPHARPTGLAAWEAWQGIGGHIAVCPCCRNRLITP